MRDNTKKAGTSLNSFKPLKKLKPIVGGPSVLEIKSQGSNSRLFCWI